jgi:predicted phosphodiesterase
VRIQVISDLHMEFQKGVPDIANAGADVLILGGDICVADHLHSNPHAGRSDLIQKGWYADDALRYRQFLDHCSRNWPQVIYVMGNHEHYHGRWDRTEVTLRDELRYWPNIALMEQDKMVLDDVVFLGATLWSSFNDGDPLTLLSMRDMMNDYRQITEHADGKYHKLRPLTTLARHRETVRWLQVMLAEDQRPTVIVTHHCPSWQSVHPKYASEQITNGAFCSHLDDLMMDHDHIKLWTFGHTHWAHQYRINQADCICNPHGYPGERRDFDPALVVEVSNHGL